VRRELNRVKEENAILKKAVGIFEAHHGCANRPR